MYQINKLLSQSGRRLNNFATPAQRSIVSNQQRLHFSNESENYRQVQYDSPQLFDKILVANRGEIACRVMRTAKKLGIKTVAIYSEPDRDGEHVKMADEAYCVGPAASAESYLNIPKILEVINETGAQAVHPGYGFLSENSQFCGDLEKNNTVFIGPGSRAIEAMGDKIESKEFAISAGVNTIPGCLDVIKDAEDAVRVSNDVGYPVMIKASAGGGGKGMRIAWNDDEARQGFRLSTEEAKASFGDDRIFIEKFIEEPRHIEIQLVGDSHGNVLCLPERECSIQRRNQKVLEESPSPFIDPETRKKMQDQAAALAKAVDYKSAGTVEFLCDKHKNFYFLEMNTRLQVEHPVTELVSGVDLVELMLHVAAGHPIPQELLEKPIPINGWAHEARVYAEDPFRGFLPSIGRLNDYREPKGLGLRVDSGVTQGSEISMFYDPMISKTISHGATREEALDLLGDALDNYIIRGVGHNVNFLREVTRHPRFISGKLTTKFIEEEYPEGFTGVQLQNEEKARLALHAAAVHVDRLECSRIQDGVIDEPSVSNEWVCSVGKEKFTVQLKSMDNMEMFGFGQGDDEDITVTDSEGNVFSFKNNFITSIDGKIVHFNTELPDDDNLSADVVQLLDNLPLGYKLQYKGAICDVHVLSKQEEEFNSHMLPKKEVDYSKLLVSPMPGALVSINVKEGDQVFVGQEICVVEAMKMQNVLSCEVNGVVKKVHHDAGATLAVDEIIVEFE